MTYRVYSRKQRKKTKRDRSKRAPHVIKQRNQPEDQAEDSNETTEHAQGKEQNALKKPSKWGSFLNWTTKHSLALQVIMPSVFSAFILAAIIVQAVIYQRQWSLSHEALIKLDRPFVFHTHTNFVVREDWGRPGKYWCSIKPIIENVGNTPTKDMWIAIEYSVRDAPLPKGFDFPVPPDAEPAVIGPKGNIIGRVGTILDDDMLAVQQGTKYIYMWGTITYRDNFEGTAVHTTEFCNYITDVIGDPRHPLNSDKTAAVDFTFRFCSEHNRAN